MPIMSTPQHLKHAKTRATKLKGTADTTLSFCLLRKKGTKEVIVHFDKPGAVSKFKNPVSIHRLLQKTAAFRYPPDHPFFADITKLVSMAGLASNPSGSSVQFNQTVGKAVEADLAIACKDLKIKGFSFEKGITSFKQAETNVKEEALRENLRTMELPDVATIAGDPLAVFGSFDEFASTLEALSGADLDPAMTAIYRKLKDAYGRIADWTDDGGIEVVEGALEELGGIEDFDAEVAALEAFEAEALEEMKESVTVLRKETRELLREKGFLESTFTDSAKLIATLSEGHYMLIRNIKMEYGGGPLLMVSSSATFPHQDMLSELATSSSRDLGTFMKSRSGKKIAFSGRGTRGVLRDALHATGMVLKVYKVDSFDSLQDELQRQKVDVASADALLDMRKKVLKVLPELDVLINDGHLLPAFYSYTKGEFSSENLEFYLQVHPTGSSHKGTLDRDKLCASKQDLFGRYVRQDSELMVNITGATRDAATAIADNTALGNGRFDTIDFESMLPAVRDNLKMSFTGFRMSDALVQAFLDSHSIRRAYL